MADRPIECSHCKKPLKVVYKEITEESMIVTEMCADCPNLQRKIHGDVGVVKKEKQATGVACGNCGTNLEWIQMGNPLGCSECYDVFSDVLLAELVEAKKIPKRLEASVQKRRHLPLHIGKSPTKFSGAVPSEKLTSLNDALKEALKKENYEQAAWLRDQIKALLEKKENGKDQTAEGNS